MSKDNLPERLAYLYNMYLARLNVAWEAREPSMFDRWIFDLGFKCDTTQDAIILVSAIERDLRCRDFEETIKKHRGEPYDKEFNEFLGRPIDKAASARAGFDLFRDQIQLPESVYRVWDSEDESGFVRFFATEEAADAAIGLHKQYNLETGRRIVWDGVDHGEYEYGHEGHYMNSSLYEIRDMVRTQSIGDSDEELANARKEMAKRFQNDFSHLEGKVKPRPPKTVFMVDSDSNWRNDVIGYFSSREHAEEAIKLEYEFDRLLDRSSDEYWIEEFVLYYDGQYTIDDVKGSQ